MFDNLNLGVTPLRRQLRRSIYRVLALLALLRAAKCTEYQLDWTGNSSPVRKKKVPVCETLQIQSSGKDDLWRVSNVGKWSSCDFQGAEILSSNGKRSHLYTPTLDWMDNKPNRYLASKYDGSCEKGKRVIVRIAPRLEIAKHTACLRPRCGNMKVFVKSMSFGKCKKKVRATGGQPRRYKWMGCEYDTALRTCTCYQCRPGFSEHNNANKKCTRMKNC